MLTGAVVLTVGGRARGWQHPKAGCPGFPPAAAAAAWGATAPLFRGPAEAFPSTSGVCTEEGSFGAGKEESSEAASSGVTLK